MRPLVIENPPWLFLITGKWCWLGDPRIRIVLSCKVFIVKYISCHIHPTRIRRSYSSLVLFSAWLDVEKSKSLELLLVPGRPLSVTLGDFFLPSICFYVLLVINNNCLTQVSFLRSQISWKRQNRGTISLWLFMFWWHQCKVSLTNYCWSKNWRRLGGYNQYNIITSSTDGVLHLLTEGTSDHHMNLVHPQN